VRPHELKIFLSNCRSLKQKLPALADILSRKFDLLFFVETWLPDPVLLPDSVLLSDSSYQIFRRDRETTGGGLAVFYKKSLKVSRVKIPKKFCHLEILTVNLAMAKSEINFVLFYRPPRPDLRYLEDFGDYMKSICSKRISLVTLGDFNLPQIDWMTKTASDRLHRAFLDITFEHNLTQYVSESTRGKNILDLVLSNDESLIRDILVTEPFASSDHDSIEFAIECAANPPPTPFKDFLNSDFVQIRSYLMRVPWGIEFSLCTTIDQYWDLFTNHLNSAIDNFVPLRTPSSRKYPLETLKILRQKTAAWKKFKAAKNLKLPFVDLKQKYEMLKHQFNQSVLRNHTKTESNLVALRNDSKFFRYVNKKLTNKSGIPTLLDDKQKLIQTDIGKANILNNQFAAVFQRDDENFVDFPIRTVETISTVFITEEKVLESLLNLKKKLGLGPDGLSAFFLHEIAYSIVQPLSTIFEFSIRHHQIPMIWRHANVCPIYKKGDTAVASNYRPVSITCVCCRVLESIIQGELMSFFLSANVITDKQFGFLAKKSTVLSLITSVNSWSCAFENSTPTDILYLDFSKAFDIVCHSKLLNKLQSYGVFFEQ